MSTQATARKDFSDAETADSQLFSPYRLGGLELANRIVMSPMTRSRALAGNVPLRTFGQLKQLWQARTEGPDPEEMDSAGPSPQPEENPTNQGQEPSTHAPEGSIPPPAPAAPSEAEMPAQ